MQEATHDKSNTSNAKSYELMRRTANDMTRDKTTLVQYNIIRATTDAGEIKATKSNATRVISIYRPDEVYIGIVSVHDIRELAQEEEEERTFGDARSKRGNWYIRNSPSKELS